MKYYLFKILRYVAAAIGGVLLADGHITALDLEAVMGAVSVIGSVGVSVYQSKKRANRLFVSEDEYKGAK